MKKRVKRKGRKKGPENKVGKIIEREEKRKKNGFKMTEGNLFQSAASASAQSGATSMGKGAWDCDSRKAIPPEKEVREKNTRKRGEEEAVEREGRKNKKTAAQKKKLEQAEVFEEIPTMDFPFHGIPTVPPRKDMMHLVSGKKRERERKNRERERKNREKERQREREQRTTHSKREGGKKRFLLPDLLLPGLPLSRHRRALMDLRGCQARPLGRWDLEVQQGGRQGEHARDEEVGGLGAKEREKGKREKPPLFSTLSDGEKKRKNPNPKS